MEGNGSSTLDSRGFYRRDPTDLGANLNIAMETAALRPDAALEQATPEVIESERQPGDF